MTVSGYPYDGFLIPAQRGQIVGKYCGEQPADPGGQPCEPTPRRTPDLSGAILTPPSHRARRSGHILRSPPPPPLRAS